MNDLLLLATLLEGPTHGYALKKKIGQITGQGEMHNNLVYPLLKRFVATGWVSQKTVPGERGQTRERYVLTAKGKTELMKRLAEFTARDAASGSSFNLRVGLFVIISEEARERILASREAWLSERAEKLAGLSAAMNLGTWGGEVVAFLRRQIEAEKKWVARLRKKSRQSKTPGKKLSGRAGR